MKAIFLDVDGVLNSNHWSKMHPPGLLYRESKDIDPENMKHLVNLLNQHTSVKVIICSDWRKILSMDELKLVFSQFGFPVETIIGYTPVIHNVIRGIEVELYLSKNSHITEFCCLDNDAHFGKLNTNLVQTNEEIGLQESDLKKIEHILKLN